MLHDTIANKPLNSWPEDWNDLCAFLGIEENDEAAWKELVTTYFRSDALPQEGPQDYKTYFQEAWGIIRPNLEKEQDCFIQAAEAGFDIYLKRMLEQSDNKQELLNLKTGLNNTALHLAVQGNHSAAARVLIEAGADVNAIGHDNETPLHQAAAQNNAVITQLLLQKGASYDVVRYDGQMPIHIAAMVGAADVLDVLLQHDKKQIGFKEKEECTPFICAAISNQLKEEAVLDVFLKHGADINEVNIISGSALHIAANKNNPKTVALLLARGADKDIQSQTNQTPLQYCMAKTSVAAATVLLEHGANINTQPPLLILLERMGRGNPRYNEMLALLQKHGVKMEAPVSDNKNVR